MHGHVISHELCVLTLILKQFLKLYEAINEVIYLNTITYHKTCNCMSAILQEVILSSSAHASTNYLNNSSQIYSNYLSE